MKTVFNNVYLTLFGNVLGGLTLMVVRVLRFTVSGRMAISNFVI